MRCLLVIFINSGPVGLCQCRRSNRDGNNGLSGCSSDKSGLTAAVGIGRVPSIHFTVECRYTTASGGRRTHAFSGWIVLRRYNFYRILVEVEANVFVLGQFRDAWVAFASGFFMNSLLIRFGCLSSVSGSPALLCGEFLASLFSFLPRGLCGAGISASL